MYHQQERSTISMAAERENRNVWDEQEHPFDDDDFPLQTRASKPIISTATAITSEELAKPIVMLVEDGEVNNGDETANGNNMAHLDDDDHEAQPHDVLIVDGGGPEEAVSLHFDHKTGSDSSCESSLFEPDHGHHVLDHGSSLFEADPGYRVLDHGSSLFEADPGYQVLNHGSSLFEADPGYQVLGNTEKESDARNRPSGLTDRQNGHQAKKGIVFKTTNSEIKPSEDVVIMSEDEGEQEYDVETVIRKQKTHELFCPNCNSCITERVILRKRKRTIRQDIHHKTKRDKFEATVAPTINLDTNDGTVHIDDREPEAFRCLSCFSYFIPSAGKEFRPFRCFGDWNDEQEPQYHQQSTATNRCWFFSIFTSDKGETAADGDTRNSTRDVNSIEALTSPLLSNDTEQQPESGHPVVSETAEKYDKTPDKVPEIEAVDEILSGKVWPISSAQDEETIHLGEGGKVSGFTSTETTMSTKTTTVTYLDDRSDDVDAKKTGDPVQHSEVTVTQQWNSSHVSGYNQIPQHGTSIVVNSALIEDTMPRPQLGNAKTDHPASYDIIPPSQGSSFFGQPARFGEYMSDAIAQAENDMKTGVGASNHTPTYIKTTFTHSEERTDNAVNINKPEHVLIPVAEAEAARRTKHEVAQGSTVSNNSEALLETGVVINVGGQGPFPGEERDIDILKSIVYGGLIESITSLGVVTSAVGAGASTLNIVALALANMIGGLLIIFHNLRELHKDNNVSETTEIGRRALDRYLELLGRREHYTRHVVFVVLSYLIFGLLPPVVYGFSFRKSGDKNYKLAAVSAVSLVCVILLALGKGHVRRPKSYFKTLMYYVSLAVMASGLSYIVGTLIEILLTKLDWLDSTSSSFVLGSCPTSTN